MRIDDGDPRAECVARTPPPSSAQGSPSTPSLSEADLPLAGAIRSELEQLLADPSIRDAAPDEPERPRDERLARAIVRRLWDERPHEASS